jgi:hypothetical protein
MSLRSLGLRSTCMLLVLGPACAEPRPADPTPATTGASDTGDDAAVSETGRPVTGTGTTAATDASDTGSAPCEPVTVPLPNVERPVGVVMLVDNSAGMGEEAAEVSARTNALASLVGARAETTFVMISAYPSDDPQGVCVDPPLGNGGCPASDDHPPAYIHVDLPVTPLDAISHVFVTYAQWAAVLPEGAKRHLVVVSDGDTGVGVDDFREAFVMLDPELNASYRFHVSVAHRACEQATTPGEGWRAHAEASGGYDHDLCTQDYGAFFDGLGARILDDLGDRCRWQLPAPPTGIELDPEQVELIVDADGLRTVFPRVGSAAECDASSIGWYWEDPATTDVMLACPETCSLLLGFTTVDSSVRFGCPPEGADGSSS